MKTLFFAAPGFEGLARRYARARGGAYAQVAVGRFANGELHARLRADVRGKDCAVVGSAAPPEDRLVSLCFVAHTLKTNGARRVTAVAPYLAYARHDAKEKGRSLGVALVGALLAASGVDRLETIDLHSKDAASLLGLPTVSRPAAPLFAPLLRRWAAGAVVVAPDSGAIARAEAFRRASGVSLPIATLEKRRTGRGVVHGRLAGTIVRRAIVVDDILDTGGTLVSCVERLRAAGAREIVVVVTHGLFTGGTWKRLRRLGVARILVSDSVPQPKAGRRGVTVVRLKP